MTDDLGALQTSTGVQGCPARGCTAKLGAGDGRDTHARIFRTFSLHGQLSGERDDSPPPLPLNDLLGTLVCVYL